ncbi:E3 ubiquitin-protein ligase TRIM39-like [Mantella aurantiaca]
MASANLECSVCRNTYTDPVILQCGHNFCQVCIYRTMDTQKGFGGCFCPVCRKRFRSLPTMQRNLPLHNIAQQHQEDSKIFCTYCLDSSVPAVKSCLLCDAYLCDKHLTAHNKAPEHVLLDPTTSLQTRKCPTHKELIKYYCIEDGSCICVSCTLAGEHRGHQVQIDLRRRLEVLEKRVLKEIPGSAVSIVKMIQDLEIKKDELSRKIRHIEKLCLSDIITEVNVYFYLQEATDILLNVDTASNKIFISDDRKTVSKSQINQKRPKTPERFQSYTQVLSSQGFSSGRHYWDVDVGGSGDWNVGVCYPSIDRRGLHSLIGMSKKSWCLDRNGDQYRVIHDRKCILLPTNISSNRVRIYLDYDAGRISFYDLCDPIRHLHTFITTFTEPLHAGCGLNSEWSEMSNSHIVVQIMESHTHNSGIA